MQNKADIKVKICGLSRECDITFANQCMPDYIGFVFAKSRRQVKLETVRNLKRMLNPDIQAVGVFVNEPIQNIEKVVAENLIDMIQLHGAEDDSYIKALRNITDKPLIQAYRIERMEDIRRAENTLADMVLLDNGNGGTGISFEWNLITTLSVPFFLAGGICRENIRQALNKNPFAVDVSSGVETDGYKDFDKMKEIVEIVRNVR